MDQILLQTFEQLGCNIKHVRLYKACMFMGATSLPLLARHARLKRSTAYIVAADMLELGLLTEDHKTYRKLYSAVSPEKILQILEAKHRRLGRINIGLRDALPELQAIHQTTVTRPRVRTYEGHTGLTMIQNDILGYRSEVLLWTNQETERQVFSQETHDNFIAKRIHQGIHIRVLAVNNPAGQSLLRDDASLLRSTRLLPPEVNFSSETYIYGNSVAVLDFGKNIFGVITENDQVAQSQRAVFELVWALRTAGSANIL